MSISDLQQVVQLVALPRGVVAGGSAPQLRVAVLVSPRLTYVSTVPGEATLADFPDWLDWPSQHVEWSVRLGGQSLTPTTVTDLGDSETWQAVFRPTVRVVSWDGDPGGPRTVGGYSYDTLAAGFAAALTGPPPFTRSDFSQAARDVLRDGYEDYGYDHTTDLAEALAQYLAFWRSPVGIVDGSLEADFHERLTLLGDHGPLLERLGLLVTLHVPVPAAPSDTTLHVDAYFMSGSSVPTSVQSPPTQVRFEPGSQVFLPRRRTPASSDLTADLHLAVDTAPFSVHSLNVDAATAGTFGVAAGDASFGPAPTSGGLVLARAGRMRQVQEELSISEQVAAATVADPLDPPARYAEQLIAGYHVEVSSDDGSTWRGLGHREVTYAVDRGDLPELSFVAVDEAAVTYVARESDSLNTVLVSDVVLRWDGWSLGAPRPGRHLLQADSGNASTDDTPGMPADAWLRMTAKVATTTASGTDGRLPVLRYGRAYRFRARAVDVGGWGYAWGSPPATPATTYYRFEPAPSPIVLPPPDAQLTRTESVRTMVVRSDPRSGQLSTQLSFRTLVPPRASVDSALLHGWLDDPATGTPDPARHGMIVALDEAVVPTTGAPSSGTTAGTTTVRWLPDPMSSGVHVGLLPAGAGDFVDPEVEGRDLTYVPSGAADPTGRASLGDWRGVNLVLEGRSSGLPAIQSTGTNGGFPFLRVVLGPGQSRRLAIRPQPHPSWLPSHGIASWQTGTPAEVAAAVATGQVPQLTPTTYVDVVHAVRRPLSDPAVTLLTADRDAGAKEARMSVTVSCHGDSTGRITVLGSWKERIDTGPGSVDAGIVVPSQRSVARNRIVETTVDGDPTSSSVNLHLTAVVPFADLRRRDVTVTAIGTSRFVPEFREVLPVVFAGTVAPLTSGVDPESVQVLRLDRPLGLDRDYRFTSSGNGWRIELLDGADAEGVRVEGVRGSVLATSNGASAAYSVIVPSAVRPDPPKVLYAVPSFSVAEPERDGAGAWHAGRGASRLRIYLERPWWSSGDGEQLAVVTSLSNNLSGDSEGTSPYARLVTLYGADPAIGSGPYPSRTADLVSGAPIGGTLDEGLSVVTTFGARTHEVRYDVDRDLYFTEVQLKPQPAGTFVRLAVARYQPFVAGALSKLSRIVAMDPVQVLPARDLVVRRRRTKAKDVVQVVVKGDIHRGAIGIAAPILKISIQTKSYRAAGPDLGWDTVSVATAKPRSDLKAFTPIEVTVPDLGKAEARVLVEELETWATENEIGRLVDPAPVGRRPTDVGSASEGWRARRPTWIATTPMPAP